MQRVDDCDHSGAFLAAATSANTVTYRINALGQRVQKIGAGTFAQPTTIPFAVTLSNPPTQAQLQALNTQVTAFYANTRFIYDEQGRLLGENEHRDSGGKFRRRLTLRSKVKRSGRSQYSKDGKLVEETVWFDDLPVAVLKPKGASATSPVSGTGNVATNNQDANNTGTNGNTAPPVAPTAKVNVEVFYVHPDHLGTPRVITASTALAATTGTGITSAQTVNKAVWRWDSDPFGSNATANSAPNENPNTLSQVVGTATLPYLFGFDLAFPGQKRDRETGKHYNYFRDYDPQVGRYFGSDPIGISAGPATFGYVGQSPLRFVDSKGLDRQGVGSCTLTITEDCGSKAGCCPYQALMTLSCPGVPDITIPGNSWPSPGNGNPGIRGGRYTGLFCDKCHKGRTVPGIVLEGDGKIPTLGPNPNNPGSPEWSTHIHVHCGGRNTRGSEGCLTAPPPHCKLLWDQLRNFSPIVHVNLQRLPCIAP